MVRKSKSLDDTITVPTPMIETLLPPEAALATVRGDDPRAELFPEEARQIDGAVASRLAEFTTGRACARAALAKLGIPPAPILRGPQREPVWPPGVVGSITHCRGYRAAAVARQSDLVAIGIDAETDAPLPAGVLRQVTVEQERMWLQDAPASVHWDRLLFSAKESTFKAWFPLARTWLGFEDALVILCPDDGTFYVRLRVPVPAEAYPFLSGIRGRFMIRDGLILTSIAVRRDDGSHPMPGHGR